MFYSDVNHKSVSVPLFIFDYCATFYLLAYKT